MAEGPDRRMESGRISRERKVMILSGKSPGQTDRSGSRPSRRNPEERNRQSRNPGAGMTPLPWRNI